MSVGRFSLFTAIVFGFILFMGTGETSADSVPEAEVDFAAQVKACYTPWVNEDPEGSDCNKERYSDYDNDTEFAYSGFMVNYRIYFEGDASDDDGYITGYEWKFEHLEWYQGREIAWPDYYREECERDVDGNESHRAYCTIDLSYGPWNVSFRAKDDDGYWSSWSEGYSVFVSSNIEIRKIDSNESQIDEGESMEFEARVESNRDYDYWYDEDTCCRYNYSKFVSYVWWSDRDGIIASGNISSDELWYGNEDGNDSDDSRCCTQYFESMVEVDNLSAGGHEISFWVMNEYGGWTQYCQDNGCPLLISVVAEGDLVPETEVDFVAQVKACYTPWVNEDPEWSDCNKERYSDYDNDTEFAYSG
ncbi:MAG: hypothetical protein VX898_04185, partial [Candidatus Thermoplasmatota archaeon]|nr:hypothetical protein [Candidatus Thermoplasmatota archaeon]